MRNPRRLTNTPYRIHHLGLGFSTDRRVRSWSAGGASCGADANVRGARALPRLARGPAPFRRHQPHHRMARGARWMAPPARPGEPRPPSLALVGRRQLAGRPSEPATAPVAGQPGVPRPLIWRPEFRPGPANSLLPHFIAVDSLLPRRRTRATADAHAAAATSSRWLDHQIIISRRPAIHSAAL
jgi:hypothetical protein